MKTMGEAQVISLVALAVAFLGLLLNSRKDTRQDAAETARVQAKLDSLINGVDEIRLEMRSMQKDIRTQGERIAKIEGRLDLLEKDKAKEE